MPSSTEPSRIAVKAERPYQVLVGYDLLAEVPTLLGQCVQRVALLHPPTMIKTAERLAQLLTSAGLESIRIDVPDAEAANAVGRFLETPALHGRTQSLGSAVVRQPTWPGLSQRPGCGVSEWSWFPPPCLGWSMPP
jgi:hypothetical protein